MKTTIIATAIFATCTSASAQLVDGQHLQQTCASTNEGQRAACVGYVSGVIDDATRLHLFCLPQKMRPEDIFNRTVNYLKNNAKQIGGLTGSEQVLVALKAQWPCANAAPQQQATVPQRQAAVPQIQQPQPVPLQRIPPPQLVPQRRYIPLLPPPPGMNCYYNMFLGSPVCH